MARYLPFPMIISACPAIALMIRGSIAVPSPHPTPHPPCTSVGSATRLIGIIDSVC